GQAYRLALRDHDRLAVAFQGEGFAAKTETAHAESHRWARRKGGARQTTYYAASRPHIPHIRPDRAELKTTCPRHDAQIRRRAMMGVLRQRRTRARRPAFPSLFMNARVAFSWLFAAVSAVMLGLAAGAVWMVPTLYLQRPLPWLAVVVGWLLGK